MEKLLENIVGGRLNDKDVVGILYNGNFIFDRNFIKYTIDVDPGSPSEPLNTVNGYGYKYLPCLDDYTTNSHSYYELISIRLKDGSITSDLSIPVNEIEKILIGCPKEVYKISFRKSRIKEVIDIIISSLTDMNSMFYNCDSLTSLNLSNLNTSNVTDMRYMFSGCDSLTSLDLSNFDTSNVTSMFGMFTNMTSSNTVYLNSKKWTLDVSSYDTNFVYLDGRLVAAYKYDSSICEDFIPEFNAEFTDYVVKDIDTTDGNVTRTIASDTLPTLIRFGSNDISGTGDYTKQSSLLEVNNLNTSNVTDMSLMFYRCKNLT